MIKTLIKKSFKTNEDLNRITFENLNSLLIKASEILKKKINKKKNIFWCGNGGSAAQADHFLQLAQ